MRRLLLYLENADVSYESVYCNYHTQGPLHSAMGRQGVLYPQVTRAIPIPTGTRHEAVGARDLRAALDSYGLPATDRRNDRHETVTSYRQRGCLVRVTDRLTGRKCERGLRAFLDYQFVPTKGL
jgi:hypothetical protein